MKSLFVLSAFVLIGAVAGQGEGKGPSITDTLVRRGMILEDAVKRTIHELREQGHGHLVFALEHQLVLVEALIFDLHQSSVLTEHHKHTIEEELLHIENRVSEEIAIINHFRDGHHHHNGDNGAQLIARGEKLVKEAKEAVAKFPKSREVRDIESEVIVVEALIKTIQAKPAPTAAELKKDEEELARHEKTLAQLIEKAAHRGH